MIAARGAKECRKGEQSRYIFALQHLRVPQGYSPISWNPFFDMRKVKTNKQTTVIYKKK